MRKPILRRPIVERMAAQGRPAPDNEFADVYVAAIRAGLSEAQAAALAALAYDAAHNYSWHLPDGALRMATRQCQADQHPNGQWARLIKKHGPSALYFDESNPRVREWHLD